MKVLFLTKYSKEGASSRLRSYQYFPLLENDGIEVIVKPLFNTAYVKGILNGNTSKLKVLKLYLKRFFVLFSLNKFDNIVIEKELFPFFPATLERLIVLLGYKYTVIYDDAIFHNYDLHPNKLIRLFLKEKIDTVMKKSSCVIVGNKYLQERALKANAKKTVIIPTVIDLERYKQVNPNTMQKTIIGWIGSPSSFQYVKLIEQILKQIVLQYDVKIHIIGTNEKLNIDDKYVRYIKWSEDTEIEQLKKFSIGIMPLKNTPWELGKCSYKLIQYMGCSIPVIASPVGMNKEVVLNDKNGYLAATESEWKTYFEKLIKKPELRIEMGKQGRILVEENYSLNKTYPTFKKAITLI